MTPTQIKLGLAGLVALLAWLFTTKAGSAAAPGTKTSTLDIDANVDSPNFGRPIADIEAEKAAGRNPAVNPEMRRLIDVSNAILDADAADQTP